MLVAALAQQGGVAGEADGVAADEHEHGRTHAEIKALIGGSELSPFVKRRALAIFQRVAVAEGEIDGRPAAANVLPVARDSPEKPGPTRPMIEESLTIWSTPMPICGMVGSSAADKTPATAKVKKKDTLSRCAMFMGISGLN